MRRAAGGRLYRVRMCGLTALMCARLYVSPEGARRSPPAERDRQSLPVGTNCFTPWGPASAQASRASATSDQDSAGKYMWSPYQPFACNTLSADGPAHAIAKAHAPGPSVPLQAFSSDHSQEHLQGCTIIPPLIGHTKGVLTTSTCASAISLE